MTLLIQLLRILDFAQMANTVLAFIVSPRVYHTTQLTTLALQHQVIHGITAIKTADFSLSNHC